MHLDSLACVTPRHHFSQRETWQELQQHPSFPELHGRSRSILEKVLTQDSAGIGGRQFATSDLQQVFSRNAQELNHAYEQAAPELAMVALERALAQAGCRADQLDALIVCSCTGYLCPGPSSYVAEKAGMRPNAYLMDLVGLGCGAAIPALRAAHGYLAANPGHKVAVVAVEISSAAFYIDNDPGVLVSLCLFGDGAAAGIFSRHPNPVGSLEFGHFDTHHEPAKREKIRFTNAGGKLKNQLHRSVPAHAAAAVSTLYARRRSDPEQILAHSGGRDVIDQIEASIPGYHLTETREVLHRHGNMSSPSVLFALEQRLRTHPQTQSLWLTAFGAGFAAHSCEVTRR